MPTFPVPPRQVPYCLNPLNFRHILRVAYWIYCYPTALRYYLYRAGPSLYRTAPGEKLLKTLTAKAYSSLFLCLPLTIALVSISLSAIALLFAAAFTPIAAFSWRHWLLGLCIGDIIGLLFFLIFSVTFSLTVGTARGSVGGSTISVTAGVANAAVLAVVLGLSPDWSFAQLLVSSNFSVIALFAFVVTISVAITIGDLIGSIIGIATGIASGVIAGTVYGIIATAIDRIEISSLVYATIIGLATSGAFGASMTFASCLIICIAMGVFVGFSIDVALYQNGIIVERALLYGFVATLIVWTGTLRLVPIHIGYLLSVVFRLASSKPLKTHPIVWDELIVLPLPGTYRYLEKVLQQDRTRGLQLLVHVARNPLQSTIVQRVLKKYLSQSEDFLVALYELLNMSISGAYVFAPVDANDWTLVPANRQLLLGELSGQWVDCTSERTSYLVERFLFGLTWMQRDHSRTAQTAFYRFLYDISYGVELREEEFTLTNYAPVYSAFEHQPAGVEIKQSFDAIAQCLSASQTSQLAKVSKLTAHLPPVKRAIRPDVIDVLNRFEKIAGDISSAAKSKSLVIQQGALLRSNSALEALNQQVIPSVLSPESRLLKQIAEQWSRFITVTGGEIGQLNVSLSFLENPYVIGTPVTGDALIGREDILRRIADELFITPGRCPSIVLYGHRRMGKSSILRNLSTYLSSPKIKIVDFNMQILGHISSTAELLYALARQVYRSLSPKQTRLLGRPERISFIEKNPYHVLDDIFYRLNPVLSGYSVIIAIDEFEKIEEKIKKGQLSEGILEFLRGLTQTYSWFSLVFAGLHTLEEMCYSYWHPFFTSIPIRVSFLSPHTARQLIVQANNIVYENDMVDRIIQLTNGQPYLIQLIGHTLVTYFNRNLLSKREIQNSFLVFNLEDLQKVLDSPEFYTIGNAYFKGVWLQALTGSALGQTKILKQLAKEPMSAKQLVEATGYSDSEIAIALNTLREHDVVVLVGSNFTYAVELMRLWVVSHQLY